MNHTISQGGVAALISGLGAELKSLRDGRGTEYIWQAAPPWTRSAPVLFPIVGRMRDDQLRHGGEIYRLGQHGFARNRVFDWLDRSPDSCRLALSDDSETRAVYPFAFRLELHYAMQDGALTTTFIVINTGAEPLPVSFGAHPGFNWPLRPDVPPEDYTLTFAQEEPAPVRRLAGGLLRPEQFPSPVEGRVLKLREDLFEADAIIMDQVASRSVRFSAPAGPGLDVGWDGFRELGVWMRPGARFLCIEPWLGFASPADFDGPFIDKPGVALIPSGDTRSASMRIAVLPEVD
jgi:galactose mutarotase-like enzyme